MGLILDSSALIAAERNRFDLPRLFAKYAHEEFFIAAVTASELLHGVERAQPAARRKERSSYVESILAEIETIDFDVAVARRHAVLWAALEKAGCIIGAHDLLIAASAVEYAYALVTLNGAEFKRIPGLKLVDPAPFVP